MPSLYVKFTFTLRFSFETFSLEWSSSWMFTGLKNEVILFVFFSLVVMMISLEIISNLIYYNSAYFFNKHYLDIVCFNFIKKAFHLNKKKSK